MKKKRPEPCIGGGKRKKHGGIRDTVSQTVETKNTNGTKCSTLTLRPTFWGRSVTISVGLTNSTFGTYVVSCGWDVLGSYPSEVVTFGS